MTVFKSGFVTLIGRPNVGKSTLLNRLVQHKVAITSAKPQTTRNVIRGIHTDEKAQLVFLDTPGVHKSKNNLDNFMLQSISRALEAVEAVLFILNVCEKVGPGDRYILEQLDDLPVPIFLLVNKIDQVSTKQLAEYLEDLGATEAFEAIIPISARTGAGLEELMDHLLKILPAGPKYYPEDMVTDHPEYFVISELIREKVLSQTHDEIPHSTAVKVTEMKKSKEGLIHIFADIYVERNSQKGIVIGRAGKMIKAIGSQTRPEIEALLGEQVNLKLEVKVEKNWRKHEFSLKNLGYTLDPH